ncbi:MAG: DUF1232 domain-containing protein [candidate division KSB1 bacterium]|nr:DUF1232 domain-containing protein [candidate division KSB1 bacterium]MDZ7335199.1 DUF1232 domain-containing protein [candidate division KSB1 bacterium]MDZ7356514.1 DUF1232 domain-containing protein [candidate division KSB1 bacterium]MDZ7376710.1 DUF1232 domain-containing protein [candidate division KSB1 bacterium]MDZ7400741.1 DUF1232 domain-containing protein [candidate division KSB1 bacterium]
MAIEFRRIIQRGLQNPTDFFRAIIHLPKLIRLYWRLMFDSRVPWSPKIVLLVALFYIVSPIDLLPDWLLPLLGYVDDLIILMFALRHFIMKCPKEVIEEHIAAIVRSR